MLERPLRVASFIVLATLIGCARLLGADELSFDGAGGCSGSADCDGGDAAGAGGTQAVPELACQSHRECTPTPWDEPKVCLDGACVALKNDSGCELVLGEENLQKNTPPFVFGILANLPLEESADARSYYLAVREFSSMGLELGGEAVQPVAVVCDVSTTSPDQLDRNVDHLVDTLGVSALVAGVGGLELKRSFTRVHRTKGKDVFFLSPFESGSVLTTIEDDGLLWHMLPSALDLAPTFLPLVRRVEDFVRRSLEGDTRPIRLALIETTYPTDADFGHYLDRNLSFNGSSAHDNAPEHYLRLKLDSDRIDTLPTSTTEFEVLRAFDPDVIVAAAGEEFVFPIMWPLEQNRRTGARGPFYVFSPTALHVWSLHRLVTKLPGLERRIVGVNTAADEDRTLNQAYLSSLAGEFPLKDGAGTGNFYDSVYFLLYAAAAARPEHELTGRDIASGMLRLLEGQRFDVGVTHIPGVVDFLQRTDQTLSLHGTMGPPSFDVATGARRGHGNVWCMHIADGVPTNWLDVMVYDPGLHTLQGEFVCNDAF